MLHYLKEFEGNMLRMLNKSNSILHIALTSNRVYLAIIMQLIPHCNNLIRHIYHTNTCTHKSAHAIVELLWLNI